MINRQSSAIILIISAWLGVMFWHLSQLHVQPTDWAWIARLAVKDIREISLWTAAWAWVTYVRRGQSRLSQHMYIVGAACLLDEAILSLAMPWAFFAMGWPWPESLDKIFWAILTALTALLQLRIAVEKLTRRLLLLWLLASTLTVAAVSTQVWSDQNDREAIKRLPYDANIFPASVLLTPSANLEQGLDELWRKSWIQESR